MKEDLRDQALAVCLMITSDSSQLVSILDRGRSLFGIVIDSIPTLLLLAKASSNRVEIDSTTISISDLDVFELLNKILEL